MDVNESSEIASQNSHLPQSVESIQPNPLRQDTVVVDFSGNPYPASVCAPLAPISKLESQIGYEFKNKNLLEEALMHSSASSLFTPERSSNQRMEFLGDAVLGLVISTFLFSQFEDADEGILTKSRAHLVSKEGIYDRAMQLDLGDYLVLSRSEEQNEGRYRLSAVSDAFEALIGAVHLDGGFEAAHKVTSVAYQDIFENTSEIPVQKNPKGELQEFLQSLQVSDPPKYTSYDIDGPEHERIFECVVSHLGRELSRGVGKSKKAAEIQAAERALLVVREESTLDFPKVPNTIQPSENASGNEVEGMDSKS